jgi:Ni/Fe-hydrogenase subunit HybB-like protein
VNRSAAAPLDRPFNTPGVRVLLLLMVVGAAFAAIRFRSGLGAVAHLDDRFPWGLWVAVDVATGVALAAGGFTTAALAHIFHRHRYESLTRPALLTAALGYTFVALGLFVDLGRYYNIWHPVLPSMWSGHSPLFEVAMCVMAYLTVLYIELMPLLVERFAGRVRLPGPLALFDRPAEGCLRLFDATLGRVMSVFIILGVVLSCLHQSSLGTLMLLAPSKMNPLWWTPILPLLFLLSAVAVGLSMVIFESLVSAWAFHRRPEMEVLESLSRIVPVVLLVYLGCKAADVAIRGVAPHLLDRSPASIIFMVEVGLGVVVPIMLMLWPRVRRSPRLLLGAATLTVLGVAGNRIDVFLVAYSPPFADHRYFPSFGEIAVTVGLIAGLVLLYRFLVTVLPILPGGEHTGPAHPDRHRSRIRVAADWGKW